MTAPTDERTELVDLVPDTGGPRARRRAWLWCCCVLLVVALYLCGWTAYALNGLTDYGRYRQLEPGQPARAVGAELRLTSLVASDRLINQITDESVPPTPGASWVVIEVEVHRVSAYDPFICSFSLLGPDRRLWEADSSLVSRDADSSCSEEQTPIGATARIERVFQVPDRYLDQLAGVVVEDFNRDAKQVLVPPA